ncbi:hypothetical protein [uncultured Methanobacterium sp.]|uniref:hypothetical protein n=1 Tax=uncultured Methanobacterium sp. TaxID=176306 RepID=UPI002AA7EEC5|nr:hypothetical protein [uncultured Methanobacterium sp.]
MKDYGALGDGVTNDTTSIMDAYENGAKILFPPGVYICDLDFEGQRVEILGSGVGWHNISNPLDRPQTVLKTGKTEIGNPETDFVLQIGGKAGLNRQNMGSSVKNLSIDGDGKVGGLGLYGVATDVEHPDTHMNALSEGIFEQLSIWDPLIGIGIYGGEGTEEEDSTNSGADNVVFANTFRQIQMYDSQEASVWIGNRATYNSFHDLNLYHNNKYSIYNLGGFNRFSMCAVDGYAYNKGAHSVFTNFVFERIWNRPEGFSNGAYGLNAAFWNDVGANGCIFDLTFIGVQCNPYVEQHVTPGIGDMANIGLLTFAQGNVINSIRSQEMWVDTENLELQEFLQENGAPLYLIFMGDHSSGVIHYAEVPVELNNPYDETANPTGDPYPYTLDIYINAGSGISSTSPKERWIFGTGTFFNGATPGTIIAKTTPPTLGTWNKGDICYNNNPSPGSYVGWICVTAGSPGTWKGFGIIET